MNKQTATEKGTESTVTLMEPKKTIGEQGVRRRQLGYACIIVGLLLSLLTGFGFFTIDASILWPVLTTGAALLGIGLVKDYSENKYVRNEINYKK